MSLTSIHLIFLLFCIVLKKNYQREIFSILDFVFIKFKQSLKIPVLVWPLHRIFPVCNIMATAGIKLFDKDLIRIDLQIFIAFILFHHKI